MAQIQDTSTPDANEIMADDLEKAQRARFNEAENIYGFFLEPHELEVLEQIHHFRGQSRYSGIRRRTMNPRGRG